MANFLYLSPANQTSRGGTAAATVDTDYDSDHLVNGLPNALTRGTSGSFSASLTFPAAGTVNFGGVFTHNLTVAVTVGGGVSGTIAASATQPDGVPLNTYTTFTPTSASGVTLSASNPTTWVIGDVIFGNATSLTLPKLSSDDRGQANFTRKLDVDVASILPYDDGRVGSAPWKGVFILTTAELDAINACYLAQRNGTRPTVIVRDTSINEAMLGFWQPPQYNPLGPALWRVQLTFEELPRLRHAT